MEPEDAARGIGRRRRRVGSGEAAGERKTGKVNIVLGDWARNAGKENSDQDGAGTGDGGANDPNAIIISSIFQPRIRRNCGPPEGVVRLRCEKLELEDASGLYSASCLIKDQG